MPKAWNPRFAAFAAAHGMSPEAAQAVPGWGFRFTQWNEARWREFEALHPEWRLPRSSGFDGRERRCWFRMQRADVYDAWLAKREETPA